MTSHLDESGVLHALKKTAFRPYGTTHEVDCKYTKIYVMVDSPFHFKEGDPAKKQRSKHGTEVAALDYSLIEAASLDDINPADDLYTATIFTIELGEASLPWEYAALLDSA